MLTNFGCCMMWGHCTHVHIYTCIMVSGQLMGGTRGNCADIRMWYSTGLRYYIYYYITEA